MYYKEKYKEIIENEIQGHQIRTRGYPTYELNEPDIHFYSKLEKRSAQRNTITELEDKTGKIQRDNDELIKIAEEYYTTLHPIKWT